MVIVRGMGQVEVAVLAAMTRSRRRELGYTRGDCCAAGGPSVATLAAIEQGRLVSPSDDVLRQLDAALRWPPGTARDAVADPGRAVGGAAAVATTLREHKLLYHELVARGAGSEAVAVAAAMLSQPLRAELRYRIDTADVEVLLAIDNLLASSKPAKPLPAAVGGRSVPRGRVRRPAPEVSDGAGGSVSLRDLRLNRGWSLDDVVGKVNALQQVSGGRAVASRGTLSAIESGSRGMSAQMAGRLEQVYGLAPLTLAVYAGGRRTAIREGPYATMSRALDRGDARAG